MILKRIAPFSLAKISGVLYTIIGLIVGCVFAMISLLGSAVSQNMGGHAFGALFGVGAIIFFPVLYGMLGFIGSLIVAATTTCSPPRSAASVELVAKPDLPAAPTVMPTPA
jgi:hypothetical protein